MAGDYQLLPGPAIHHRRSAWRRPLLLVPILLVAALFVGHQARRPAQLTAEQDEPSTVLESPSTEPSAAPAADVERQTPGDRLGFTPRLHCNRLTTTITGAGERWLSPTPSLPETSRLDERLEAWLASPVASHDKWTRFNEQTCGSGSVRRAANKLHGRQSQETWERLDGDRVRELREGMAEMLKKAQKEGRFKVQGRESKRGIVFTAGNADTVDRTIVTLRLLRSFGTTLPAEVWHFASEQPSSDQISTLKSLKAVVRPVEGVDKQVDFARVKSFHIKGAALVQSAFDELLYLDSDSLPVRDVTSLFEGKGYRKMGAVFWQDYWRDTADNGIWSVLGVQCRDEFTMEAGQFVIDKRRHLDALLLVEHMLQDWQFWFKLSDGDKDLFRYAFLALRKRWAVPGRSISSASWTSETELGEEHQGQFCGHTMVHSDEQGEPLFVHANLLKRIVGDFHQGSTWGRTLRLNLPARPKASAFVDDRQADFIVTADHLANANSGGVAILPAPPHVRKRAALERGIHAFFWDGHRGNSYALCVQTMWTDPRLPYRELPDGEQQVEEEGAPLETEEQCGPQSASVDVGYGQAAMEIVQWQEDPALKWFEAGFYEHGGRASGSGFR